MTTHVGRHIRYEKWEAKTSMSWSSSTKVRPVVAPCPKLSGVPLVASTPRTVYRSSQVKMAVPSIRFGEATRTHQADPVMWNGRTLMGTCAALEAGWMASSEDSATTKARFPRARPSTASELLVILAWMMRCRWKKCLTMITSGNVGEAELDGRALKGFVEWRASPRFMARNWGTTYRLACALSWASVSWCLRAVCLARKREETTLSRRACDSLSTSAGIKKGRATAETGRLLGRSRRAADRSISPLLMARIWMADEIPRCLSGSESRATRTRGK
mmetsp:Transcript_3188/g.8809  ORF Transcript_3188/g.8809 Transcript_3188/m.8809 type:complete len:275 (-) Transcript_3188:3318-4142(-)